MGLIYRYRCAHHSQLINMVEISFLFSDIVSFILLQPWLLYFLAQRQKKRTLTYTHIHAFACLLTLQLSCGNPFDRIYHVEMVSYCKTLSQKLHQNGIDIKLITVHRWWIFSHQKCQTHMCGVCVCTKYHKYL